MFLYINQTKKKMADYILLIKIKENGWKLGFVEEQTYEYYNL